MEVPSVEIDLGGLDQPLIGEARRLALAAPRGQKRILSIERPLVYRLRHGRWRGATWLETEAARFWLCAGAQREADSGEDAYEIFAARCTEPGGSCPMPMTCSVTNSSATPASSTMPPTRSPPSLPMPSPIETAT